MLRTIWKTIWKKITGLRAMSAKRYDKVINDYYYYDENVISLTDLGIPCSDSDSFREMTEAVICDKIFNEETYMLNEGV